MTFNRPRIAPTIEYKRGGICNKCKKLTEIFGIKVISGQSFGFPISRPGSSGGGMFNYVGWSVFHCCPKCYVKSCMRRGTNILDKESLKYVEDVKNAKQEIDKEKIAWQKKEFKDATQNKRITKEIVARDEIDPRAIQNLSRKP